MAPGMQQNPGSMLPALGPPLPKPLTKKRPHRRSPQACDECRLRKRACDAANPCHQCQRADLTCTYQFRRPVPPPTLRIRDLQDHLRLARTWLQHVKDTAPDLPGLNLDECLRTLDFTQPTPSETVSPSPTTPAATKSSPGTPTSTVARSDQSRTRGLSVQRQDAGGLLAGRDRTAVLSTGQACCYGIFSDVSFALRTIDLFREEPTLEEQSATARIRSIFVSHVPREVPLLDHPSPDDPPSIHGLSLDTSHVLLSFISREQLRELTLQQSSSDDDISLLHLCLALQHLSEGRKHQSRTCHYAETQAQLEFNKGVKYLIPVDHDTLTSLQALLCATTCMLTTGRMLAAHSLISTASSSAVRMGLLPMGMSTCDLDGGNITVRTLATLMALDMLVSLILDLPPSLPEGATTEADILTLARHFESQKDWRTAATLRQLCLLLVPKSARDRSRQSPAALADSAPNASMENIRLLESAHAGFRRWMRDSSLLLTSLGQGDEEKIMREDLEMTYNFCQIIVFRSHLHHLRSAAVGGSMSKAQSYHALACLKIATSTIGHVDLPAGSVQLGTIASSWLRIYTILSAVMCLVFLIAAHPGTARPSVAWQRAHRGIRVLAACSCGNNIAAACLELVKVVTSELSHTVYFDYDEIESSVRRVCDGERRTTSPVLTTSELALGSGFMDIPADQMLIQADTLTEEFDFSDLMHFGEEDL